MSDQRTDQRTDPMWAAIERVRPIVMRAAAAEQETNRRRAVADALVQATTGELLTELAKRIDK